MKPIKPDWPGVVCRIAVNFDVVLVVLMSLCWFGTDRPAVAQAVATTTVQGTVYLANGQVGAGTLILSWPAFTTASGQSVAADKETVTIAADGFVSVNLAPNLGATPAGFYYTAIYYLSDGTTTTQYWVVPAAAQASLAQVQAQLMPAAQAVQTVSKAYVDQQISEALGSILGANGGTLTGPLYLSGDPTQPLQAADKHYVDETFAEAVPLAGGDMTGALQSPDLDGVESPLAGTTQTTLQTAINAAGTTGAMQIPPTYTGSDTFNNTNGLFVTDLRPGAAQQRERSVKEFGAVCDGTTDDTKALQAALSYANAHSITLTVPQGTCKTRTLAWRGESIGGLGKQVSALMGFPGQDVLAASADNPNLLSYTHIHDLTIYVDQSVDASCSAAVGRLPAGQCTFSRLMEKNSIFSPGGNGLTNTAGSGAAWAVGNCAIAMPAATGAGGNGLRVAELENVEIVPTGVDPLAAQYPGVHSTHACGFYLAQWPQWSEFRNIDVRGLNTGIAIPPLPVATPAGLNSDSNRWQNVTIQATHAFTSSAGSNNILDNVVAVVGNNAGAAEPPTGLVLDLASSQQGWTVRNAVVLPSWLPVPPTLAVTASGGAVTQVALGSEHGLGYDPYGTQVPVAFSGNCTAQANAAITSGGSVNSVTVTAGGTGCSGTTTASINVTGGWDTAAPVNLIGGQNMSLFAGNLLKGNGGYTVWNATGSQTSGTQLDGGGGNLPGGGTYPALVSNAALGSSLPVDQFSGADFGAKLQACVSSLSSAYGGTCDARNFTGTLSMGSNLTLSAGNAAILLPCATISTAAQIIVTAGTRNVALHGCALQGGSAASGNKGGTAFLYSGSAALFQIGDPTYATDTPGFRIDNVVVNTTAASASTAQGLVAYRAQELNLEELYFLGNANQTAMTLDGTGNYTGGSFLGSHISGFQVGINAIGHQTANAATTDWLNASTFVRMHIDCPTSSGNPIAGTIGVNLVQGDGNTFVGGDVEGCSTAVHLGANAQNNTLTGLRNENSGNQVVADSGSSYNSWLSGGTLFTGKVQDNGTRNSFLDTFHRSFNGLNGDWYGSQQDATITDHQRLGTGAGNERGRVTEYQTDYGYRWQEGLGDGTSGLQSWFVNDMLNNVNRIAVGQYLGAASNVVSNVILNNGGCYTSSAAPTISFSGGSGTGAAATATMATSTSLSCPSGYTVSAVAMTSGGSAYTTQPSIAFAGSNQTTVPNAVAEIVPTGGTNNQTLLNAAGTGAVVLNGSNNAGTGGVVIGSGGPSATTVATINNAGNAQLNGTLVVDGTSQSTGTMTVRNNADAEVDYYLWPGLTASQKGSYTYKDFNGASQWYMVKDASNNWSLNSALGGLDSFKAYQSTNSGDTYVNAANSSGVVRMNYESGSGTQFKVYGGSSSSLYASFTAPTAIQFPGLAAASGHNCVQVDNSGYLTNTGAACGSGSGSGGSGTVNTGSSGQIAYYAAAGTAVTGVSQVPVAAGGTGAATATAALTNLGAQAVIPGLSSDGADGVAVASNGAFGGALSAKNLSSIGPRYDVTQFGAAGNGSTDDTAAIQAAFTSCYNGGTSGHGGFVEFPGNHQYEITNTIYTYDGCKIEGVGGTESGVGPPLIQWNGGTVNYSVTLNNFTVQPNIASITMSTNPIAGDTVNVNGTVVTFVASGATGNQVNIGANSSSTITALTTFLNASSDTNIVKSKPYTATGFVSNLAIATAGAGQANGTFYIQSTNGSGTGANGNYTISGGAVTAVSLVNQGGGYTSTPTFTVAEGGTPGTLTATVVTNTVMFNTSTAPFLPSVATSDPTKIQVFNVQNPLHSPASLGFSPTNQVPVTFNVSNTFAVGNWVYLTGFTQSGLGLNRVLAQVTSAASSSFTVMTTVGTNNPLYGNNVALQGNYTDSGTAAQWNVALAYDSFGRYQNLIKDITINPGNGGQTIALVDYVGRLDTGSGFDNASTNGFPGFGIYMSDGGINILFDHQSRVDGGAIADVYYRVGTAAGDDVTFRNMTVNLNNTDGGAHFMLDNGGCQGGSLHATFQNVNDEDDQFASNPAYGNLTIYDCPNQYVPQFDIDLDHYIESEGGVCNTGVMMSPPNDLSLHMTMVASQINGCTAANRWIGLQAIARQDMAGTLGFEDLLNYAPSIGSIGSGVFSSSVMGFEAPSQLLGDISVGQLWQYQNKASAFSYIDTAFAAAPNGTTLYAGQILAPPAYWNGSNGKRYALDVVYQTGTTGTPNGGATTCTTTVTGKLPNSPNYGATCTSATDLSHGQKIAVSGGGSGQIENIDATNPTAILVWTNSNLGDSLSGSLSFVAPVIGPEIQFPTKSAGAPTTLAWSQGDIEQNSGATVGGIAAYVNVAAGTPGTWGAIPLGSATGVLGPAQIGTGTPSAGQYVDGATGAWTNIPGASVSPAVPLWLQYLGTGADGAINCSGNTSGEVYATTWTVSLGTTCTVNLPLGLVIHATGNCAVNGTINDYPSSPAAVGGSSGGGGGGGTAAGNTSSATKSLSGAGSVVGASGAAGAASGGTGGTGNTPSPTYQRMVAASGAGNDGVALSGSAGGQGGSTGGAGGNAGGGLVLICGSITGTGTINANGLAGTNSAANNTGGGGGGGGGVVILSSQTTESTWPTIHVSGGAGGTCGSYTGCGVGGAGGAGWLAEFSGW